MVFTHEDFLILLWDMESFFLLLLNLLLMLIIIWNKLLATEYGYFIFVFSISEVVIRCPWTWKNTDSSEVS